MSYCLKTDAKGIFLTSSHGDIIDTGKTLKCFTIDGENYLVVSGYIITNRWIKHNSKWCYPGADGKFIKNAFVKDSTGYAYLDEDGYFNSELNAWKLIDNKYYRIESGYQVRNAWRKDSTQKYCYLTADGSIFEITGSGWVQIEKEIYYLENNYYRVENSERPDLTGKSCFLDASGKLIRNMLLEVADGIAYLNDKGQIDTGYTGWLFLNNNWW